MTNLFSSIPLIGEDIVFRLWGGAGGFAVEQQFWCLLEYEYEHFSTIPF